MPYIRRGAMVRLKVAQLLRDRGPTAYQLAKEAGFTQPRAYRLASESGEFDRLKQDALNRLCAFFDVQPGEILEWIPDPTNSAPKRGRAA